MAAHNAGIDLYVIGVTPRVNVTEIRQVSSRPRTENQTYWLLPDFQNLDGVTRDVKRQLCTSTNARLPSRDKNP